MKKAVYKFDADCGRMGYLEGVFVSTEEKVKKLIECEVEVYFGEVLGKHSEICGSIEKNEISFVSSNPEVVKVVEEHGLTSGHNPFEYTFIGVEMEGVDLDDMMVDEYIDILLKDD